VDASTVLDCDVFDLVGRVLQTYPDPIPFDDFGSYRIIGLIGSGGMGDVFLAEDYQAGRRVAIKLLRNLWSDPDLRQRFVREIHLLAELEHPFIARLYEVGVHPNGTPYFAMEYVDGVPLDRYFLEQACPLEARLRLFHSVCEAVQYAHGRAVIHLDLKPSNILVKSDGTPKLLDFGIARRLENLNQPVNQTQLRCTPAFAAPEQIRREPVGTYTDVYALGVVLYELLAGRHPYRLEECTPGEAETIVCEREPVKPSASENRAEAGRSAWSDLDVLCLKAMKKDVQKRYHSVVELAQDLDRFLNGEPLRARPDRWTYRAAKFFRRNRRAVLATTATSVLLAGLIAFYTIRLARARDSAVMQAARTQRIQHFMLSMFGGDYNAAPSGDLRVVDILNRSVNQARMLQRDPAVQADLYETLGSIYQNLGKLDRAESVLQSGLNIRKSVFGSDNPEVADAMMALGLVRVDQARFGDAERLLRQAVAIDRRYLPHDDQRLGNALSSLGSMLEHRGVYGEAIRVLDEAIRIQSGPAAAPADLAESLTYLANVHNFLGHGAQAESLYRRILSLDRQIYGDRHPSVSQDLANLAEIQKQLGWYDEAERNERQSLQIVKAWYSNDNFEVALDSEALAETLLYERKYDEATHLLPSALETHERDLGKDHPYVAFALNLLGVLALKRGNLDEAEADFNRMDRIYHIAFGDKDRHVALGRLRFGELYEARKDYPRAEQVFRESIRVFTEALSADNVQTGTARIELGGVLLREGRYREAEAELLAGYHIVTPGRSPSLEAAVEARRGLVSVYEALNAPDKAARFRSEEMTARSNTAGRKISQ
jgi:serine/threonine-protein kinase